MAIIDIKLKSYQELQFEITKLNTDLYLKDKENKRLNNIINKLEKLIEQYSQNDYYYKYNGRYLKSKIINDLKELKEGEEND